MHTDRRLAPCILFLALLGASPAFAQGNAAGGAGTGMSAQEAESFAKMIFGTDISAGRLTVQKAGALFVCANERYAQKLGPTRASGLSEATQALMEHQDKGVALSDAKKAQYGRAYKEAFQLQREAEDGCRKELGSDPSVQRVFQDAGGQRR